MRGMKIRLAAAICLGLWFAAIHCSAQAGPSRSEVVTGLKLKYSRYIDYIGEAPLHICLSDASGRRRDIELRVREFHHEGERKVSREDGVDVRPWRGSCYQIEAKDPKISYKWSFWSESPAGRFKAVVSSNGQNYLTWVSYCTLYFAEVSNAKDRLTKPDPNPCENSGTNIERVPIPEQIADRYPGPLAVSICARSIERDAKGTYTVRFAGGAERIVYTVVSDSTAESGWRLVSQTPAQGAAELQRKEAQRK